MFTSRAEHRLVLREDNTIDRLSAISRKLGIVSNSRLDELEKIIFKRQQLVQRLEETTIYPKAETNLIVQSLGSKALLKPLKLTEFLRRTEITFNMLSQVGFEYEYNSDVTDAVEIEVKYSGYIKKQNEIIKNTKKFEQATIPDKINFFDIKGLSSEEVDKLMKVKPRTLGQAGRISGVNPSALQAIMVYLKGRSELFYN
jgi:tRNA uridine 5-carboxymethylaminomethyl modification enzyme